MARFDREDFFLALGVTLGMAFILLGLTDFGDRSIAPDQTEYAARVNGSVITLDRYYSSLAGLATQTRGPALTTAQRRGIIEEMINQQLLLDRALSLDLARIEPIARRRLIAAMIEHIAADGNSEYFSEEEVRKFYRNNIDRFTDEAAYDIKTVFIRGAADADLGRAEKARQAWGAGKDYLAVEKEYGDRPLVEPPGGPLRIAELARYLGPTAARELRNLKVDDISPPIKVAGGYRIIRLVGKAALDPPPFEKVRDTVEKLMQREKSAGAVNDYLAQLKKDAEIEISPRILAEDDAIPSHYLEQALQAPSGESDPR